MSVKVHINYGREEASFPFSRGKTFNELAKRIKQRIREKGEGLLPSEQESFLEDKEEGRAGFIRSFSLRARGEAVYPEKQSKKINKYLENGELELTATFHYEGGYSPK